MNCRLIFHLQVPIVLPNILSVFYNRLNQIIVFPKQYKAFTVDGVLFLLFSLSRLDIAHQKLLFLEEIDSLIANFHLKLSTT